MPKPCPCSKHWSPLRCAYRCPTPTIRPLIPAFHRHRHSRSLSTTTGAPFTAQGDYKQKEAIFAAQKELLRKELSSKAELVAVLQETATSAAVPSSFGSAALAGFGSAESGSPNDAAEKDAEITHLRSLLQAADAEIQRLREEMTAATATSTAAAAPQRMEGAAQQGSNGREEPLQTSSPQSQQRPGDVAGSGSGGSRNAAGAAAMEAKVSALQEENFRLTLSLSETEERLKESKEQSKKDAANIQMLQSENDKERKR